MSAATLLLVVGPAVFAARCGWELGATVTKVARAHYHQRLCRFRCHWCPESDRKVIHGHRRATAHVKDVHGAEIQAEQIVAGERLRTMFGGGHG